MSAKSEKILSIRLTDDMRREITKALVAHAIDKRSAAHQAAGYKLALRLYNTRYSAAERKRMQELPKGWLYEANQISVNIGGQRHGFSFGPYDSKNQIVHRIPNIHADRYGDDRHMPLEPRSELGAVVRAHIEAAEKLAAERESLKAKAAGILSGVTTTARLAEVWPEVVAFIPKYVPRQLPAVRRDELNAAFNLRAEASR